MKKPKEKLHACDVLNWEHLCKLSEFIDPVIKTTDALAVFAYAITQTGDEDKRDRILTDILLKAAYGSRPESNEGLLRWIADGTHSELEPLREFAKQCGVKGKRKWW